MPSRLYYIYESYEPYCADSKSKVVPKKARPGCVLERCRYGGGVVISVKMTLSVTKPVCERAPLLAFFLFKTM